MTPPSFRLRLPAASRAFILASSLVAALASWCAPARASEGVHTTVINETSSYIRWEATGDVGCWNADAFASPFTTIDPHSTVAMYSSIKTSGGSCAFTFGDGGTNAWMYLGLFFQQPDGAWTEPISAGQDNLDTGIFSSSLYAPKLYYDTNSGFVSFVSVPSSGVWFPASPTVGGGSGDGLFCINIDYPSGEGTYDQTVYVEPAQSCEPTATATAAAAVSRATHLTHPANAPAGPAAHAAQATGVFDLEQLFQGACELINPTGQCSSLTDSSLWNLNNISSSVSNVQADATPSTGYGWGSLKPAYLEFQNNTDNTGSAGYSFTGEEGEQDSTTTTSGMTIGNAITFGIDGVSPINDTASLDLDFSSSSTQSTGGYTSTSVNSTINTSPDSTTYLYGFQGTANQAFNYTADLTFGDQSGNAEPLTTPAPAVFGYSPAQAQPCIGYLVGNAAVSASLMQLYDQAISAGYTASDPNLNSEEIAFLSAGASLTSSSAACPGFPSSSSSSAPNFSSGAGFDGSGTATLAALGGGGASSWDPNLQAIQTCAYSTAVSGSSSNPDNPCVSSTVASSSSATVSSALATSGAGAVVMASHYRPFSRIVGPNRSVLMIGGRDDHDTLITGDGQFNIIRGGRDETLIAHGRNDVLFGGPGRTRLVAGYGFDTLDAGSGDVVLSANAGHGILRGGSGNDTFNIGARARYTAVGGSGSSTFNVRGSLAQLVGGKGRTVFRLLGAGKVPNIVEPLHSGSGTLLSERSMTVPFNVGVARAIGRGPVTLRGVSTTRELIGGAGRTRLVAGPGREQLIGGTGDTTFVFSRNGQDIATGGLGRNWFMLPSVPVYTTGRAPKARPGSGDQITNFSAKRDHLVLRAADFGSKLLSSRLALVEGRNPSATGRVPTLLFDVARDVLSFDPDGTGPSDRHVIVTLRHFRCTAANVLLARRYRIHSRRGIACLAPGSISISR
ncbi:MAG: calcium-binding protein [Solirubrobacteraceae bacterium]